MRRACLLINEVLRRNKRIIAAALSLNVKCQAKSSTFNFCSLVQKSYSATELGVSSPMKASLLNRKLEIRVLEYLANDVIVVQPFAQLRVNECVDVIVRKLFAISLQCKAFLKTSTTAKKLSAVCIA